MPQFLLLFHYTQVYYKYSILIYLDTCFTYKQDTISKLYTVFNLQFESQALYLAVSKLIRRYDTVRFNIQSVF